MSRIRNLFSGRYEPENIRPLADMYWRSVLFTALVLAVMFLLYGLWIFWGVIENLNSPYTSTQPSPTPGLNRITLQEVLNTHQARSAQFEAAKNAAIPVADPSK